MVYEWRQPGRFTADAQAVGDELQQMGFRDASSVVKAARNPGTELHKCFEWDDSLAGERYREEQARLVLRMVVTVIEKPTDFEPETIRVRAFEAIRFNGPDGKPEKMMAYVPTREALTDPELRSQIMGRLEAVIESAEHTAAAYEYLVPSFGATRQRLAEARASIRA